MSRTADQIRAELAALQAELATTEEVGVYQDPKTGRWYCRLKVDNGWTTRRTYPDGRSIETRDDALTARGMWLAADERAEVVRGRMFFRDYWPHYLDAVKPDMVKRSHDDLRGHGKLRLLPHLGDILMGRLDFVVVQDWRSVMYELVEAGELAPKTVNNARQALMGCCKLAIRERKMNFNPVKEVPPLPVDRVEPAYLRIAQIPLYYDATSEHYRALAEFLVGTGARISEALATRVTDLDLHARSVTIARQLDGSGTRATKTNRVRTVFFGPGLADTLQTVILRRLNLDIEDDGWLFLCPRTRKGRHAARQDPRPPHRKTVLDWHWATLEAAGLPKMPLHALRHTAAASWLANKQGLEFVKAQLGHSTIRTTSDFYGHLDDQYRAAGAAATEALILEARKLGIVG